jgi:sulfite reductase (NADPH) flavoprotein alpha-component
LEPEPERRGKKSLENQASFPLDENATYSHSAASTRFMVKKILFQLHWIFGITAGLILAIVGFTGAILSVEDPILEAINPGVMTVSSPTNAQKLSPQELVDAIKAREPELQINSVTIKSAPRLSSQVALAPVGGGRGETRYVDPYTGALLAKPQGEEFFRSVMQLHRWILLPGGSAGAGRQIVGAATLILIYLALTGLYLRWPKRHSLKAWFKIDLTRKGRPMWWSIHSVCGTFVFIAYLIMSVTGLWWSFEWWKNGMSLALTGKPVVAQPQGGGGSTGRGGDGANAQPFVVSLAPAWTGFQQATEGKFDTASFTIPRKAGDPVQVRFLPADAQHDRANDQMRLDAETGTVVSHDRFKTKPFGEQVYSSNYNLHTGAYFGIVGVILWMLASLMMPVFFVTGWILYLKRRKAEKAAGIRAVAAQPAE